MSSPASTIFSLSSALPSHSAAAIAVVRVSGPKSESCLSLLSGKKTVAARRAELVRLTHPESGEVIDSQALAVLFRGPRSFTGEDLVEFHVHGTLLIVGELFEALRSLGCRDAAPGEFTRRAFENGKLDLTQVEGIADLLGAKTKAQKRQAVLQVDGAMGKVYSQWRKELIEVLANLEAFIDFADEDEQIAEAQEEKVAGKVREISTSMQRFLQDERRGEVVRDGLKIAIAGNPNVGKSSLLNAIARRDVSIVADVEGTTRDVVETQVDVGGFLVHISDTAGIRATEDIVEKEGIRRAKKKLVDSQLRLVVVDGARIARLVSEPLHLSFSWSEILGLDSDEEVATILNKDCILVVNKSDQVPEELRDKICQTFQPFKLCGIVYTCCLNDPIKENLKEFMQVLEKEISKRLKHSGLDEATTATNPVITRERHRSALQASLSCLQRFQENSNLEIILRAEEIRLAAKHLGEITGVIDVEEVLDVLFRDFCIGK